MSRPKSSVFLFSVLSFALLFAMGLATPERAFAQGNAKLKLSPKSLAFGNVAIGNPSPAQSVLATNKSKKVTIQFQSIAASAPFLKVGDTCDGSLGGGQMCQIDVECQPTGPGPVTGTLTFIFNAKGHKTRTQTVSLTCTGTGATPGPQAGDVLIAGGDEGGLLSGFLPLATSTTSTAAAEVYETLLDAFLGVGSLNTAREAIAPAVVLPNNKILLAGGSLCFAVTLGPGGACGNAAFDGFECDALQTAELYDESTKAFTLAGSGSGGMMTTQRSGATATLIEGSGTSLDGKVLITGGSSGSSFLSGATPPAGCGPSGQVAQNTAEIYDPVADSFTATGSIPGCAPGTAPPACTTGLPATCGTGMAQCGLVDSEAVLLNNGKVLVTGGDYIVFLGQSSPQAFIFDPATAMFSQTVAMKVPRELPSINKLPNGNVLVAGGLTGAAAACVATPSTPLAFTTNSSAEVFDPTVPSWTLTSGSSSTPGAAGGMNVNRIAAGSLFSSGTDSGLVIFAGGIDAETTDGTPGTPNFPTCESVTFIAQTTTTETDLYNPTTTVFTATGSLNQSRGGYGFGILNGGSNSGDFAVFGGECAVGTLASTAIGTPDAGGLCGPSAQTDYYELFSPSTGSWTVGTATAPSTPANAPDSVVLP